MAAQPHPFRDAFGARDLDAMREAMTPDVTLNSPILSTPFVGRDAVMELFEVILETLEDVEYTVDVAEDDLRVMSTTARVGKVPLEGAQIMRVDGEGRVKEFTIFFRPLVGVTALARALGRGLASRRSPRVGVAAGLASGPLVALSRVTDAVAPRFVK